MSSPPRFLTSSLGKKYAMGVTGLLLVLFVLGHMTGNLLIFLGPDAINTYAEFLKEAGHGVAIWVARAGLLALFLVHIVLAFMIRADNQKARPVGYQNHEPQVSDWASRHMLLTGLVILIFVLYHLAHFTLGWTDFSHDWLYPLDPKRPHYFDVYAMVVFAFRDIFITVFYIVAQAVLATHLWHGASSWFQSLGLNRNSWRSGTAWVGPLVALIVFVGNCSIPLAIQAGYGMAHMKAIDPKDGRKIPITIVNYTMGNVYPEEDEQKKDTSTRKSGAGLAAPDTLEGTPAFKKDVESGKIDLQKIRPKMGGGGFKGKDGAGKKGMGKGAPAEEKGKAAPADEKAKSAPSDEKAKSPSSDEKAKTPPADGKAKKDAESSQPKS